MNIEDLKNLNTHLDDKDFSILCERAEQFENIDGQRLGDYVLINGEYWRFTHDWNDSIQANSGGKFGSSFYIDKSGCCSYSGGLSPSMDKARLTLTEETKPGLFWFFSHNEVKAHNGVNVNIPCRVYQFS